MDPIDYASIVGNGAFAELALAAKISRKNRPKIEDLNLAELLELLQSIRNCREGMILHLVKAVSLFQTNMEALISQYEVKINGKISQNGFRKRWESAFSNLKTGHNFNSYNDFYENYRNCLVHFKMDDQKNTINVLNSIEFIDVYNGIKIGWEAFDALSSAFEQPNDANSWDIICEKHGLPNSVSESDYLKLGKFSRDVWSEWELKCASLR